MKGTQDLQAFALTFLDTADTDCCLLSLKEKSTLSTCDTSSSLQNLYIAPAIAWSPILSENISLIVKIFFCKSITSLNH